MKAVEVGATGIVNKFVLEKSGGPLMVSGAFYSKAKKSSAAEYYE